MKVRELGHAVIKVSNRERSEAFYGGVLGMKLAARHETMPMTFYNARQSSRPRPDRGR